MPPLKTRDNKKEIIFGPPPGKFNLFSYILKYIKLFWIHAAGGVVCNIVVVFGPIFLGKSIDAAILVYQKEAGLELFYLNLAAFLGFSALMQLGRFFKRFYMRETVNLMSCDIRAALLSSLFATPMRELSSEKAGDMMSRMIGDVDQVSDSVRRTITEIWDTVLLMLAYFIACLVMSTKITLIAAIPIPLAICAAHFLRKPLYNLSLKARKAAAAINIYLQHNVSGIALLRLFGLEETDRQKLPKLMERQLKWFLASAALRSGMLPIYTLLATSGIIVVVGMGGENVLGGIWTIGTFTAFLTMYTSLAGRTSSAARVMNTWHGAKASWDRICEKLKGKAEEEETAITGHSFTNPPLEANTKTHKDEYAALEVKDLSFSWPFVEESCINEINFSAGRGEIIGITGPVGCGKSALAAALSGLYPYKGEAYLYGVALKNLGAERSRKIAYMDSDHFIFSDDVIFNVSLDREGGDLEKAITLAEAHKDVAAFPKGVKTKLMERGLSISGGQRQRIALARSLYTQSQLIILDDPFSAVDINMEKAIMKNLRENTENGVILLFSHRLSMFHMTDRILVMDRGGIRQAGRHEELLGEEGLYKDIFAAQEFMTRQGEGI